MFGPRFHVIICRHLKSRRNPLVMLLSHIASNESKGLEIKTVVL
jgi:hypothetical protein